jgi:hypothetical protein
MVCKLVIKFVDDKCNLSTGITSLYWFIKYFELTIKGIFYYNKIILYIYYANTPWFIVEIQ